MYAVTQAAELDAVGGLDAYSPFRVSPVEARLTLPVIAGAADPLGSAS